MGRSLLGVRIFFLRSVQNAVCRSSYCCEWTINKTEQGSRFWKNPILHRAVRPHAAGYDSNELRADAALDRDRRGRVGRSSNLLAFIRSGAVSSGYRDGCLRSTAAEPARPRASAWSQPVKGDRGVWLSSGPIGRTARNYFQEPAHHP
jgi:hypothetical protein